ncbi:AbrB/MazE/SpoVT family DNA-binding domain-containing protein [Candidatus Pacearchaeota archaeon]|nr:AbrB/MazE/SpoVT family DNA-binding domain-containing protein [Candidatus Pacearchaeota archaeon]
MVNISTTKVSSKGQIVIPSNMRKVFKEGDTLLIIENNDSILLKRADDLDKKFEEDLEFARRTEKAWKKHDRGEFTRMDFDDFIKEMKKW